MNRSEFFASVPAMPQAKRQQVQWAYELSKKWHAEQERDTGERYFEHVRGVASILIEHGYAEAEDIVTAILHDILEDTTCPLSMLERLFGPEVARDIVTLSKSYGIEDPLTGFVSTSRERTPEEYFAGIAQSPRAARAKCADRIFNLSDLVAAHAGETRWTPEKRLAKVAETRTWIRPLAEATDTRFVAELDRLCALIEADVARVQAAG